MKIPSRDSFASIEEKIHPSVSKYKTSNTFFSNEFVDEDKSIVLQLLEFINKNDLLTTTGTGEWGWLQKNKQSIYIKALEEIVNVELNFDLNSQLLISES